VYLIILNTLFDRIVSNLITNVIFIAMYTVLDVKCVATLSICSSSKGSIKGDTEDI